MNHFSGSDFQDFNWENHDFKETIQNMKKPRFGKGLLIAAVLIAVLAFLLSGLYSIYMAYLQIQEIGEQYTSVFLTNLAVRILTQALGFVVIFILTAVNVCFIKRFAVLENFDYAFLKKKWPYLLLCLFLSFSASGALGGNLYEKLLLSYGRQDFGITDPLFNQDIGYYIFSRPFLISLVGALKTLLIVLAVKHA
ncbi:MAG: UPF0182 family protein [Clostridia bacterium]|nr:UPF0182 family protein [Clostridia bacterium]